MCALGGISLWQIGEVYQSAADLADNWLPSIEGLGDVRGAVSNVQRLSLLVILESSPAAMQA
ncbi:hypothetical protein [Paraburkholderia sp. JHI869]|uniref:hypothetical protein n=1 Tax=Paraburkholderia sp. JHI869 TaxID=3112959 RepID=UPI00317DB9E6